MGDFDTNIDYMENYYSLASEENSKAGKCVVSVYGGSTSCSEFEMFTGCTMMFMKGGNAPYQQYIHKETKALPSYLGDVYETFAVHAADPSNWNRQSAYPLIGFDEFISNESEAFADASYCRCWIDDQSMVDEIENLYHTVDEPVFVFGLTMQCHGGYDFEGYESDVQLVNMDQDFNDVEQYLSLLKGTDNAFKELIDDLKKSDEETIVLMYGDHLPNLDKEFFKEITGKTEEEYTREEIIKKYTTPYIVWANYDVDWSEFPDTISPNFFAPYLLKAAGIELDPYYEYLYDLSKKYPVISKSGIINAEGSFCEYHKGDVCYEDINEYDLVQYSRLR